MKRQTFIILIVILIIIGAVILNYSKQDKEALSNKNLIAGETNKMFKIFSPVFTEGQMLPKKYTCDGENIAPPLFFEDVPLGTQSLAIILNDPDSPSGNFDHWIIWNINPQTKEIKEGIVPDGAREGLNDFRKIGYGGPCPGSGNHRYIFNVYALDSTLSLARGSKRAELEKQLKGHVLEENSLMGRYIKLQNR